MTGGNAASDYPRTTQHTDSTIHLIQWLTKARYKRGTPVQFLSEDGAVIACHLHDPPYAHFPDVLVWDSPRVLPVYDDGSIHQKAKQMKRDLEANTHLKALGYLEPYRPTSEEIWADVNKVGMVIMGRIEP